jgi:hypothetical protein
MLIHGSDGADNYVYNRRGEPSHATTSPPTPIRCEILRDYRCHFFPLITVVMACLMTVPARSVSFFDSALVTQTFSAGWARHSCSKSRGATPRAVGMALRRVMRTPLARD